MIRECFRSLARHGEPYDVVIKVRKPLESGDSAAARLTLARLLTKVLAVR